MCELSDKIAELTIENNRIKKTSKSRFNQNKALKSDKRKLELLESRFKCLSEFLVNHGFPRKGRFGVERIDFSLFNALRGLIAKDKRVDSVSVDGIYAVKINGDYKIAKIHYAISWRIAFVDDDYEKYNGLHFYPISDFVLLELT
tara:strand:+ start:55 stop:489 length:435 start_codon:yes stop_codon:yes gene_type:complete